MIEGDGYFLNEVLSERRDRWPIGRTDAASGRKHSWLLKPEVRLAPR